MTAEGLQVKTLALSLATAVIPSADSIKCLQQSSGYCTGDAHSSMTGYMLGSKKSSAMEYVHVITKLS